VISNASVAAVVAHAVLVEQHLRCEEHADGVHMFLRLFALTHTAPARSSSNGEVSGGARCVRKQCEKDVDTVRMLLAPEMLLYEHSVRNDGATDAFENHLNPKSSRADCSYRFPTFASPLVPVSRS